MKKVIFAFLITFIGFLSFNACEKAPEITLSSPGSIEVSAQGGSSTITFTTNTDWTVRSSDSWVSVSPSSGTVTEDGIVTIKVSCTANTTYEDRSAVVTISAEDITQTVTVHQPANLGIIVPKKLYEITGKATIEVEVQSNVQYEVSISDDWITQTGTKGLVSDKLMFDVKDNDTYDARSASIVIKALKGEVPEEVVAVKQAQKDAILIDKASYEMPYGGGEIQVNVKANVGFDVKPDVDWIHYMETKALSTSTVRLVIDENKTFSSREGKVHISQQNGSLSYEISVKQAGRIAVTSVSLNRTELTLEMGATETLVATVKPDNATDKTVSWSSSNTAVAIVSSVGVVTAKAVGTATITASARDGDVRDFCIVKVYMPIGEPVDLGLSVAWASFNLGACSPTEGGNFYAWGEVCPKIVYSLDTYKWNDSGLYTKYNDADGKKVLDLEDDAAHYNWGGNWRMPTEQEFIELQANCREIKHNKEGYIEYRSKKNGKSIYFPLTRIKSIIGNVILYDYSVTFRPPMWSSTLGYYETTFFNVLPMRYNGLRVRPVCPVPVSSVQIDHNKLLMRTGYSIQLTATALPKTAANRAIRWSSDKPSVATVDNNGWVTAKSPGTAIIFAVSVDGGIAACCLVTVEQMRIGTPIDLGLSVKWSDINIGANVPEEDGDSFAWGETSPKTEYTRENYKFYYPTHQDYFSKYNQEDGNRVLDPEDDAASYLWEPAWRMPTYEEFMELISQCNKTTVEIGGKKCIRFERNGACIYLPASVPMWTSSNGGPYYTGYSYGIKLFGSSSYTYGKAIRTDGKAIRPVYGDYVVDVPVTSISLNKTNLTLTTGSTEALVATVSPTNATDKTVTWSSSNTAVATVSSSGVVTAKSVGTATITASAGGKTASCTVTVAQPSSGPEAVDLGLSVKWATYNLGASSPEEYGDYYAWGETSPKNDYSWNTYKWCNGSSNTLTKYNTNSGHGTVDNKTTLELSDDAAHVKWGGSWRMPTNAEWSELITGCTWTWTTQNEKNGYKVTSKTNGNSIFLPAAGYWYGTNLFSVGFNGDYWSSSLTTGRPSHAPSVDFGSSGVNRVSFDRSCGQPVRPVSE